jgi:hypothetical protein
MKGSVLKASCKVMTNSPGVEVLQAALGAAAAEPQAAAAVGGTQDAPTRWTINVGTQGAPKIREVVEGAFVYSESQGCWLPWDGAKLR